MTMKDYSFEKGYKNFRSNESIGATLGAYASETYVSDVENACNEFQIKMNAFKGYETDIPQLKGNVQEVWTSGTFNTNAALNESPYRTNVPRSNGFATPDITSNWGENFGLKAYGDGAASAKAQGTSYFESFKKYQSNSGNTDITFEKYLADRNISADQVLASESIYSGQTRIVPIDQFKDYLSFLKKQIAKKTITNPEEAQRWQEVYDKSKTAIEAPDGTKSVEISTEELKEKARLVKKGEYNAANDGFSPEQLIEIQHILDKGHKAGLTAGAIQLVLKAAPEIFRCLDELINDGKITEDDLKKVGFAALEGTAEGYLRGFASSVITTSCLSGQLGEALKSVEPEVIGALTVLMINTLKDSFLMAKGSISKAEFTYNLERNIFVTACGIGGGALLECVLPTFGLSYMLGSFVGSMVGSFAFVAYDKAVLSYCISSGRTFFGLVDQNYQLPDEVLEEIGVEVFEYEKYFPHTFKPIVFKPHTFEPHRFQHNTISITILRRGVIGIRQIGYIS